MFSVTLTPNQQLFSELLARLWEQERGNFLHGYPITRSRHWAPWRHRVDGRTSHWWCESLAEAADRYSWADSVTGWSFEVLSERLREAVGSGDEGAASQVCLDLFRWGGVARKPDDKSRLWLAKQLQQETLCQSLTSAVEALSPGSDSDLLDFDGVRLPMNSAMTKVYAALSPDSVLVYDGRVGAALGLLTRHLLEAKQTPRVPNDLAFRWGAKQGDTQARNPSLASYTFSSLYLPSTREMHQDRIWSALARKASQIALAAADVTGRKFTLREMETALFMVGYDVRSGELVPSVRPAVK